MAGRVTQLAKLYSENVREIIFHCIADAADGSVPDTEFDNEVYKSAQGFFLDSVEIVPGATGPTADSDLVVEDEHGLDILGGNGADLIENATVAATIPKVDSQVKRVPIRGKLTSKVTNNSVNSAVFDIIFVLVREA